jgi:hypothetical protein
MTSTSPRGRRPAPESPTRRPSRPVLALIAGVVAAGAVGTVALAQREGGDRSLRPHQASATASPPSATASPRALTAGQTWKEGALLDFNPLKGVLVPFTQSLGAWTEGKQDGAKTLASIDLALPAFLETRAGLVARAPLPQAPRALADYRLTAALYVQAARIARVGAASPSGPLQEQLKREYSRVRDLADRVFDQADVELTAFLPPAPVIEGVTIEKPAEVPSWASLDIAAGPPLDVAPTFEPRRRYQAERPNCAASASSSAPRRTPSTRQQTRRAAGCSAPACSSACWWLRRARGRHRSQRSSAVRQEPR